MVKFKTLDDFKLKAKLFLFEWTSTRKLTPKPKKSTATYA